MNLCSHSHDEICFDGKDCPLCAVKEELSESEHEVAKLERQIKGLEKQIDQLNEAATE